MRVANFIVKAGTISFIGWKTFLVVPELSNELQIWSDKHKLFDQLAGLDVQLGEIYR